MRKQAGFRRSGNTSSRGAGSDRDGANDARISYTIVDCPLGRLLLAATARGVCALSLGDSDRALEAGLARDYQGAVLEQDGKSLAPWVGKVLAYLRGREADLDLPTDVAGTPFQRRAWEALRAIPYGQTRSYAEVARSLGRPKAVRAVAGACAANPVALLVPCHRVIRTDGSLGGFGCGLKRKEALLALERANQA